MHDEIIQQLVKETDLGRSNHGEALGRVSGDVWDVLMDKSENDAYDKIEMVPMELSLAECCTVGSPMCRASAWRSKPGC